MTETVMECIAGTCVAISAAATCAVVWFVVSLLGDWLRRRAARKRLEEREDECDE